MYYTGTQQECEAYNELVSLGEGYHGTTNKWGEVLAHPTDNVFAIIKNDKYEAPLKQATIEEVSAWFPSLL